MRRARLHGVGGAVLLALVGLLSLSTPLSRSILSGTLQTCITESRGVAWLGIHLRVLVESPACPGGSDAPGPHFSEVGHISVALSSSALLAGLVALAWTMGLALWARRSLRAARAWLGHRLGLAAESPVIVVDSPVRAPLEGHVSNLRGAILGCLRHRRGPPALAPA